ncbi:hypothetical protein Tco_0699810 [Tanacetum coccineum]
MQYTNTSQDTHSNHDIDTNAQIQEMINEGNTARAELWQHVITTRNGDDSIRKKKIYIRKRWPQKAYQHTPEAAHAMPWRTLKKMMTDKYCPRGEIKKLEFKMWNLKVKEEIDKVEKYVGGLPDTIHGSVMATKPKTMQDSIEFATELMDKKINTWAERQGGLKTENVAKITASLMNRQEQPETAPNKIQNTGRAYAALNDDRRTITEGQDPLCSKCNYHMMGP